MRYIILAAGVGERLHPLTTINPKCLYKLDENSTVIKRTIDLINYYDSNAEIIVVVGYMFDMFAQELDGVKFIRNPFYKITNSIASLWFAKEYLYGDFVILNGDVVMNHALMKNIVTSPINKSCVLLDSSIKTDGDYNVQVNNNKVLVMSKKLSSYYGEYVGVTKIHSKDAEVFRNEIEQMVISGHYDQWYENALVQLIFDKDFCLNYIDVKDYEWTEIDCVDDLIKGKLIHQKEYLKNEV